MNDLSGTMTTVFGVMALVTAALAGLQYGTMKTLRSSNGDLRDRAADQDAKIAALTQKIADLAAENRALGRVVTGETYLTALASALDEHHDESMEVLRAIQTAIQHMDAAITRARRVAEHDAE